MITVKVELWPRGDESRAREREAALCVGCQSSAHPGSLCR